MAYTVLARRYRSSTFDDVIGQDHIAQTLKKAIETNRIAHAFLFTGTRGVGKTSMARILAKALNCEKSDGPTTAPCGECRSCLAIARGDDIDVIEIDAASNTGVDNIRELIDNAQFHPARGRFKVYIIDEVHMLSKSAFNALLKTLEEPPSHVKFILATTEVEKILPTILSRCQRYDFRNIPSREIVKHLVDICRQEKVAADEDALQMVARAAAGSMRDALSLLDRLLSAGEKRVSAAMIEQLLGLPKAQMVHDLAEAVGMGNLKRVLESVDQMVASGLPAETIVSALSEHFRNLLIVLTCGAGSDLVEAPGLSTDQLELQSRRFDAVLLTQDIAILEELRRNMRLSQSSRALLDASLARLALAEQFASVADLLRRADGAAPAQKKKDDLTAAHTHAPASNGRARHPSPPSAPAPAPDTPSHPAPPQAAASPASPALSALESQAAAPAPFVATDAADDDDDDLPRPGKVWEGPSLAEELAAHARATAPSRAPVRHAEPPGPNIAAVHTGDLGKIWSRLRAILNERKPSLTGVIDLARLDSVDDGEARIRFNSDGGTFARTWQKNGTRDMLRGIFSEIMGRPFGVTLHVDAADTAAPPVPAAPSAAPPPQSHESSPTRPRAFAPAASPPAPAPAADAPPQSNSARPTPEQHAEFSKDPVIGALMRELDAQIVRIVEEPSSP